MGSRSKSSRTPCAGLPVSKIDPIEFEDRQKLLGNCSETARQLLGNCSCVALPPASMQSSCVVLHMEVRMPQAQDALERPLDRLFPTRFSTAVPDAVLPPPSLESYRIHPWMRTSCIHAVVLHCWHTCHPWQKKHPVTPGVFVNEGQSSFFSVAAGVSGSGIIDGPFWSILRPSSGVA